MRLLLIIVACLFCVASTNVFAETINRQGGSVFTHRIGPWFLSRTHYEDGATLCWANNLSYGRREPAFSYMVVRGVGRPHSGMRFDSKYDAQVNETVDLVIGDEIIQMIHHADNARTAFSPMYQSEARQITTLLLARENSRRKYFFVRDQHGGEFKYDARATLRMITYLEENCGYVRN